MRRRAKGVFAKRMLSDNGVREADLCLEKTRRAAWLIAAAFSAGNQIFCDDSFFKIDKMVDALLVVFPSG